MSTERLLQKRLKSESSLENESISYTPAQVEKLYGIRQPTIRSWVRQKKIKGGHTGRIMLVDAKDFNEKYMRMLNGKGFFDA
jgi:hypothetical protein